MTKSLLPGGPVMADRVSARDVVRRLDEGTDLSLTIRGREKPWLVTLLTVIQDSIIVTREHSTNSCLIPFHSIDAMEIINDDIQLPS